MKDFDTWNSLKKKINTKESPSYVHARELWWCSTGLNIGSEIDGKNNLFERPVLILKRYNATTFTVVPVTSTLDDTYYTYIFSYKNNKQSAVLSQAKMVDSKRLTRKIGVLPKDSFSALLEKYRAMYKYESPLAGAFSEAEAINTVSVSSGAKLSTHNYNQEALDLHKLHHGKIELATKVPMNDRDDLSRAYTPGVAEVCKEIAKDPANAREYTLKRNTVAIISDGSAILGLGNLGALAAIPVMEGKAAILKSFAGVDAFPICLDTQDTEEIIKAVKQIAPVFGAVNLEDIAAPRCFEIEERLRKELSIPVMHDDQWGTATVVLGGLINALKVTGRGEGFDAKIVVNGVGSAGVAVSRLLLAYGFKNMLFCDSKGIIHEGRADDLNKEKVELITASALKGFEGSLTDAVKDADVFVGVSKAGALTIDMAKSMNKDGIVFALANPVPEIMPEVAKEAGIAVIATGRSDFANQLNNSLIFPGLFKGALSNNIKQFEIGMFTKAALALASHVKNPTKEAILPTMFDKELVEVIAGSLI